MNVDHVKPAAKAAAPTAPRRRVPILLRPIAEIVQQHGEEAAFLWMQRDRAVRSPHYTLNLLDRLDGRVEAHVDGLRVAGDEGWEIAQAGLGEPGGFFCAAVLALDGRDAARLAMVTEAASSDPVLARSFSAALAWIPWKRAESIVRPWLESPAAALRKAAMAAFALHRRDPGAPLLKAAADVDASVRARAIRALGELGLSAHLPLVQRALGDADPGVAFAAAWTTALLSKDAAPLIAILTRDRGRAGGGIALAARRSGAAWARSLSPRLAVLAAGHSGDSSDVPGLLERMKTPALARVAGEAFTMITGADLEDGLEGSAPEDFEAGPTDDPADPKVEMDPDENLPWPDLDAVGSWWKARGGAFKAGTRHLLGRPIEPAWLRSVLREGRQRQRAAAALELAMLEPGKPLFEVRAPGFRQKSQLGAGS